MFSSLLEVGTCLDENIADLQKSLLPKDLDIVKKNLYV